MEDKHFNKMYDMFKNVINATRSGEEDLKDIPQKYFTPSLLDMVNPDTYGCNKVFALFFVRCNAKLMIDFPFVFKDFLEHEYGNLASYDNYPYIEYIETGKDAADGILSNLGMNMMMNAVAGGSEYTKALFIYLFKTYHSETYKVLKRFQKLTAKDIETISEFKSKFSNEFTDEEFYGLMSTSLNIAIILYMSKLMGIEIGEDCAFFYILLNAVYAYICSDMEIRDVFREELSKDYPDAFYDTTMKYPDDEMDWLDESAKKFTEKSLMWTGFTPPRFTGCIYGDDIDYHGVGHIDRATALLLMDKACPELKDEEGYYPDDLMAFATQLLAQSRTTVLLGSVMPYSLLSVMFPKFAGKSDVTVREPILFNAEKIRPAEIKQKTEEKRKVENTDAAIDKALTDQVNELRLRVHMLESENRALRETASSVKPLKAENKALTEKMADLNREAAALRSYMYGLTESDIELTAVDYRTMKKGIAGKKIVIIGGHSNWIQKLQQEFPGWRYIPKGTGSSCDTSAVEDADYVFFFTDTISHSTYYRYLNVLRDKHLKYGYIHGVNIEKNVSHIYHELYRNEK